MANVYHSMQFSNIAYEDDSLYYSLFFFGASKLKGKQLSWDKKNTDIKSGLYGNSMKGVIPENAVSFVSFFGATNSYDS